MKENLGYMYYMKSLSPKVNESNFYKVFSGKIEPYKNILFSKYHILFKIFGLEMKLKLNRYHSMLYIHCK
jgi:hypothetical protein